MGGRALLLSWILLLCILAGSCGKNGPADELISRDNDIYADENDTYTEIMVMEGNDGKTVDGYTSNNMNENNVNKENLNEENLYSDKGNIMEEGLASSDMKDTINAENAISNLKNLSAGTIINVAGFDGEVIDSLFSIHELDRDIIDRITGKSYKEDCDVPYSDLRYIRVLHTGFDGQTRIGELIVNKAIAQDVVDIFRELYSISYPIEKMLLVDEYDADDIKSMEDNNTSAFNFRFVEGTARRSVHSDGLAIDINPLYNPYIRTRNGKLEILPASASEYADRDKDIIYYIKKDDPCYKAFTSRGFTWGGEWKNSKDYQHFEKKISD